MVCLRTNFFLKLMRTYNTLTLLCAITVAPLCVVRGREDDVVIQIVGPHFTSLPDGIFLPSIPLQEPDKPIKFWTSDFAILDGGRHRDSLNDPRLYLKKSVLDDPWWNHRSKRPPKKISPKEGYRQRRQTVRQRR